MDSSQNVLDSTLLLAGVGLVEYGVTAQSGASLAAVAMAKNVLEPLVPEVGLALDHEYQHRATINALQFTVGEFHGTSELQADLREALQSSVSPLGRRVNSIYRIPAT